MSYFLGIDLGSTTSKAVIIDKDLNIIGRGITNTRADYKVAADIARMEAEFNSRFTLLRRRLEAEGMESKLLNEVFQELSARFQYFQFEERFDRLCMAMENNAVAISHGDGAVYKAEVQAINSAIKDETRDGFLHGDLGRSTEFFRDIFSTAYLHKVNDYDKNHFDRLVSIYDKSITPVENEIIDFHFTDLTGRALAMLPEKYGKAATAIEKHLAHIKDISLEPEDYIGTGYGRQLLPFEAKHIKSEILCHAMGAHACFPETRTVLDIGGQDTKAIQIDQYGLVTSFQMNDRCAAGCGRYLGYIADEMNMSVSELGPMAMEADHEANICSTCTVFAGAELREYLNLGEKKENILAGLHRAIVQRAFALIARSGGVKNQFTFTGGVARNTAVVKYVSIMVRENYGEIKINCHHDSIFMGALGAAIYSARRK